MIKKLISLHHWLGTFFFVLFTVWFLSGFVMMYKGFPSLSSKDKVQMNEALQLNEDKLVSPKIVFSDVTEASISECKINAFNGKVLYHLTLEDGKKYTRFANGATFEMTRQNALTHAKELTGIKVPGTVEVLKEVDQWIPRPKFMKHLPVYKVVFNDDAHTWVHLSSETGEALNVTTRNDRFWAWLGAIPHWIYFRDIRIYSTFWSNLICWLSALGLIMTLTGIVTGIVRYKKKPKAKFRRFKNRWYNIHYYTGLFFGLFVCTWIFSGFMSMTPFNWTSDTSLSPNELARWQGSTFTLNDFEENTINTWVDSTSVGAVKEIRFTKFDGRVLSQKDNGSTISVSDLDGVSFALTRENIMEKIESFNTASTIKSAKVLYAYDNYYYDRKKRKVLPVVKCVEGNTAYYVDPVTAKVLLKSDATNRTERWLYHGLHSLDFSFLTNNRPLWDIVMILLLLGGTAVCVTACGLGIKFMRRKAKKYKKKIINR